MICKCFHKEEEVIYFTDHTVSHLVGVCWGTKEKDQCSCNGDQLKCDFYPKVREQATQGQLKLSKIIRCKNCSVPHNNFTGCPRLNGLVTDPDFFCGFAESK